MDKLKESCSVSESNIHATKKNQNETRNVGQRKKDKKRRRFMKQ